MKKGVILLTIGIIELLAILLVITCTHYLALDFSELIDIVIYALLVCTTTGFIGIGVIIMEHKVVQ
jgi:hypothetical protein